MSVLVRYLQPYLKKDLKKKMVLVGGPRQVGKTTLALSFLSPSEIQNPAYLNWDDLESKSLIRMGQLPADYPLIVLDEIHKYKKWRNLIKGFYDKHRHKHQFLITGSARIDHYSKGGDSLVGRYHLYRMHPLSVNELGLKTHQEVQRLIDFGGFPEPYFLADAVEAKRWRRERLRRVALEDIKDLEQVKDISSVEHLISLLPPVISAQLSYQSLANEIEVDPKTIQKWIEIFDNLYITYRVFPYIPKKLKVVKRTPRLYFWDWGGIENKGAAFENFVGSHLLKYCHFTEDVQGDTMELRYLKDVEGREIDFIILKNKKPLFAVECKYGDRACSPHLHYFKEKTDIPFFYQVHMGKKHYYADEKIEVLPFTEFCKKLQLP